MSTTKNGQNPSFLLDFESRATMVIGHDSTWTRGFGSGSDLNNPHEFVADVIDNRKMCQANFSIGFYENKTTRLLAVVRGLHADYLICTLIHML